MNSLKRPASKQRSRFQSIDVPMGNTVSGRGLRQKSSNGSIARSKHSVDHVAERVRVLDYVMHVHNAQAMKRKRDEKVLRQKEETIRHHMKESISSAWQGVIQQRRTRSQMSALDYEESTTITRPKTQQGQRDAKTIWHGAYKIVGLSRRFNKDETA